VISLGRPSTEALRVVALGAHPDDIEIGAGATLLRLASRHGRELELDGLILTSTPERAAEAQQSFGRLGALVGRASLEVLTLRDGFVPSQWDKAKEALAALAHRSSADIVIAPNRHDAHQDHRALAELVTTVWRDHLVLGYEIPKFDGDLSRPNFYVRLDAAAVEEKWTLLNESFPTQRGKDWFDRETMFSLARLRGIECHERYAEAFHVSKAIVDL
jgi:LmbE family N-acetylglucosaminyl deacetylase